MSTDRPELFARYLAWSADFLRRCAHITDRTPDVPRASVLLQAMEHELEALSQPDLAAAVAPALIAARSAVAPEPPP